MLVYILGARTLVYPGANVGTRVALMFNPPGLGDRRLETTRLTQRLRSPLSRTNLSSQTYKAKQAPSREACQILYGLLICGDGAALWGLIKTRIFTRIEDR